MNLRLCFLRVILGIGSWIGNVFAQGVDLPYSSGSTGADGAFTVPSSASHSMDFGFAYDRARKKAVRFGGEPWGGSPINETWEYDAAGWVQRSPATSPPARAHAMMAYDAERQRVVLFGGRGASGNQVLNDTWLYNGTNWQQVTAGPMPPARQRAAMAYDEVRKEIVLTGGLGASDYLSDTWVWNGSAWVQKSPATPPPVGLDAMAWYPPSNLVVAFGGYAWDGTTWSAVSNENAPTYGSGTLSYDPVRQQLLYCGGVGPQSVPQSTFSTWRHDRGWQAVGGPVALSGHEAVWHEEMGQLIVAFGSTMNWPFQVPHYDTLGWNGTQWLYKAGTRYTFDLNSRADAIWNFTTINIPTGVTVSFLKNAANYPVLWLASGAVNIAGTLDLNGGNGGYERLDPGGAGGPGGYDGGSNGNPNIPAEAANIKGQGPGGGTIPTETGPGQDATHASTPSQGTYGTPFAQPLVGGSGGSGAVDTAGGLYMGTGGGGGGAILIASSADITVTGRIEARGGAGGGAGYAGHLGGNGSGGTVRLVADRVFCTEGTIDVGNTGEGKGRIRIEALFRQVNDEKLIGTVTKSVPVAGSVLSQVGGRLFITKVAGETVAAPPQGREINPDVVFTASGPVQVEVEALNVPDDTPVTLTITHGLAGTLNWPTSGQVTLQNGKAVFNGMIPAGSGVMQAFATYEAGGAPSP